MYRPLPDGLTIQNSSIEGLGLFATEDFPAGHEFGMTHGFFDSDWIRTPLGGFYNHSDDPNCETRKESQGRLFSFRAMFLVSIKSIKAGDELTAKYTLYQIGE